MRDNSMRHYRGGSDNGWDSRKWDEICSTIALVVIVIGGIVLSGYLWGGW